MTEEELSRRLEENTTAIKEVHDLALKIARYVRWLKIMDFVKILLILLPLIAAYIYLPTLIKDLMGSYSGLMPTNLLR